VSRYLATQALQLLVVLFGVVTITFLVLRLTGDPLTTLLPPDASEQQRQLLRHQLGLDQPFGIQYLTFLGEASHGDFGRSITTGIPAMTLVRNQVPQSLELAALGMALAALVGVVGGSLAAVYHNRWPDRLVTTVAVAGQAMPVYWLGLILIIVFAVQLGLLPASGNEGVESLILPVISLSVVLLPYILRVTRATMLEVLRSDFIRFHRAKGLSPAGVILKHALKNSLAPVVTLLGLQAGVLMGGVVAIEFIFARPGMGSLLIHSIYSRDYPVVQAAVFTIALVVVLANFLSDLAVAWIDPRVRLGARAG
jgi:ABC-type dipeptide/oligopeptide/nickel transport system permease component